MDRRSKIILGLFGAVLLAIIVSEIVRPRPLNWQPSYTADDTIPFGCFILFEEMKILFPNTPITKVEESVYDVLSKRDTTKASNYMLINDHLSFDKQETHQLLDYVKKGNTVFMAANSLGYILADTLNLSLEYEYSILEDTATVSLTNQRFKKQEYLYSRGINKAHFVRVDTTSTTILGYIGFERKDGITQAVEEEVKKPNFIKTQFGQGHFLINTTPQAFSNYYLLKGNEDYASNILSYLDEQPLYWDNYKKSGRVIIDSPMRFVLNQSALKWAYYLTIVGLLFFVVFKVKREQRIIPVLEPKENTSVEFARTVGSLYYQTKDYSDLVQKKIKYFQSYVRNRFYLDISNSSEKTIQQLAAKSGKSLESTKKLMDYLIYLKGKSMHTEQDIINLNKKINVFKQ